MIVFTVLCASTATKNVARFWKKHKKFIPLSTRFAFEKIIIKVDRKVDRETMNQPRTIGPVHAFTIPISLSILRYSSDNCFKLRFSVTFKILKYFLEISRTDKAEISTSISENARYVKKINISKIIEEYPINCIVTLSEMASTSLFFVSFQIHKDHKECASRLSRVFLSL